MYILYIPIQNAQKAERQHKTKFNKFQTKRDTVGIVVVLAFGSEN